MTVRFVPHHTRSALDEIASECHRTSAERDAFAAFADRIADLDGATIRNPPQPEPVDAHSLVQSTPNSGTALCTVRESYRETIMSVPHYNDEYDESLRENLSIEFSPEIATILTTGDRLLSSVQDHLIAECHKTCERRGALLRALEDEANGLNSINSRLTTLGSECSDLLAVRSFDEWSDEQRSAAHQRLQTYERECKQIGIERQKTLHKQRVPSKQRTDLEFVVYLYDPLSITYPVLADIASFTQTLQIRHQRIDSTRSE